MRSLLTRYKFVCCWVMGVWMLVSTPSRAQEPAPPPATPSGLPAEPQASTPPMPEPEAAPVKTPIEVEVGGGMIIDGTTSYAQPNRDTQAQLAIPGAHRRNQFFARAEPVVQLGSDMKLTLGASAMYAQADIPTLADKQDVRRVAADVTINAGGLAAWAEYSQQFGRHVTESPAPGVSSDDNRYVMLGVEYTYDWLTARYNFNYGDYNEVDYTETRHIPGVAAVLDDHLTLLLELVFANATLGDASILLDKSVNLTVQINF